MRTDWRNPVDYAYLWEQDMTPQRWAWEFLRRNSDYLQAWESALMSHEARAVMRREGLSADHPDLYIPLRESWKWDLIAFYNPHTPAPKTLRFRQHFSRIISGKQIEQLAKKPYPSTRSQPSRRALEVHPLRLSGEQAAAIFDLSKPLKPQMQRIYAKLLRWQKHYLETGDIKVILARNHPEKWPLYLRCLNAERAGAPLREIAAILFPDEPDVYPEHTARKNGYETLEQAHALVQEGYKKILLLPSA